MIGPSHLKLASLCVLALCVAGSVWLVSAAEGQRALHAAIQALSRLIACAQERLTALGPQGSKQATLAEVLEMIDVIQLGLLAGLSFDAALGLYCAERTGPLARLMGRAQMSWQIGMLSREDALREAAIESGVPAMEPFALAISQALSLGAPLADTLAGQARECRAAHRAEIERDIERAPIKLLIPTGTLILPALLLSIVGPLLAAGNLF